MDATETKIFILALVLFILIGSIVLFIFYSIRKSHRRIIEMKRLNNSSEINSIELERARIAADLHDELSPIVSAVKMKVRAFSGLNNLDKEQQEKVNDHLAEISQKLRAISFDLMPLTLLRSGLKAAVEEFIIKIAGELPMSITIEENKNHSLSEKQSIHLYRIVQEIIHNTLKHSSASKLELYIKVDGETLIFSSGDNGKGFDFEKMINDGGGYGLRNLLSRTDVMNGTLEVQSNSKGTSYQISIPLE